jgi:hypothetical protein
MVRFPVEARDVFLVHSVRTGSGALSTPCAVSTGVSFLRVKWPGREADHLLPLSARVKNVWSCASTVLYVFRAYFLTKHRDNLSSATKFLADRIYCHLIYIYIYIDIYTG